MSTPFRVALCLLTSLFMVRSTEGKNFIKYHRRSLVVQEHMAEGSYDKALVLLNRLDRRYGLMPTEIVARAICLTSLGDTAAAHKDYLRSVEQRSDLGWMHATRPKFHSERDSIWYEQVVKECVGRWQSMPRYSDWPNPGIPTPTTDLNTRHQNMYEHAGQGPEHEKHYAALIAEHDALLKRFLSGDLPVPSIAEYGINQEFSTFLIHCSPELTIANARTLKRWLKAGLIYPELYATPFDDQANQRNEPIPYGIFTGLRSEEMLPGHEKRRARIGMGDQRLEHLRFHRPSW